MDADIDNYRPLSLLGLTPRERGERLRSTGWHDINLSGYTSNCRVPGRVERYFAERFGFSYSIFEISREVRSGTVSRAEATRLLEQATLKARSDTPAAPDPFTGVTIQT